MEEKQHLFDRRRCIWMVDDSPTDAERVRKLVANEHDVRIFQDGAEALERLSEGSIPDLLVLDWIMPQISGIEICEYVRSARGRLRNIPILLLTARHRREEIVMAFEKGANDYVVKPFVDEELSARMTALLNAKRLVERAEEAEADVRALLESAPDAIFSVDAQGKVSFANAEATRVLSKPCAELVGKPVAEVVPDLNLMNITVAPGSSLLPLRDVEIGERIFSSSVRILPSDNAASTTIALRDVTSRRKSEARRLDFYSIIAHDLRAPITTALLRLQLVQRGKFGVLSGGLIQELRQIESTLNSQLGLINDFLEIARFEGTGYKIALEPVDVVDVVRSTLEDFQPLALKNEQELKLSSSDSVTGRVFGDRQRLAQVLSNLVSNAIKFTPPGGKIAVTVVEAERHLEVMVQDTGRGIAPGEVGQIFSRFARGGESERTPGSGLGLMIVREIVEAHGGTVGVESHVGLGSRFWFRLPLRRAGESI